VTPPGPERSAGRHLRWIAPLAFGIAGFVVFQALLTGVQSGDVLADHPARAWVGLGSFLLSWSFAIVGFILSVSGAVRTFRESRQARRDARDEDARREQANRERQAATEQAWEASRYLRWSIANSQNPSPIPVWDIVPHPGEKFFYDLTAAYARFHGVTPILNRSDGFYAGHPIFVAAVIPSGAQTAPATIAALEQWQEPQDARVVVSNARLICFVGGQVQSFPYSDMTAVYPEVEHRLLICQLKSEQPLLLTGPTVPLAAVITVRVALGPDAVANHPSLVPLDY